MLARYFNVYKTLTDDRHAAEAATAIPGTCDPASLVWKIVPSVGILHDGAMTLVKDLNHPALLLRIPSTQLAFREYAHGAISMYMSVDDTTADFVRGVESRCNQFVIDNPTYPDATRREVFTFHSNLGALEFDDHEDRMTLKYKLVTPMAAIDAANGRLLQGLRELMTTSSATDVTLCMGCVWKCSQLAGVSWYLVGGIFHRLPVEVK